MLRCSVPVRRIVVLYYQGGRPSAEVRTYACSEAARSSAPPRGSGPDRVLFDVLRWCQAPAVARGWPRCSVRRLIVAHLSQHRVMMEPLGMVLIYSPRRWCLEGPSIGKRARQPKQCRYHGHAEESKAHPGRFHSLPSLWGQQGPQELEAEAEVGAGWAGTVELCNKT